MIASFLVAAGALAACSSSAPSKTSSTAPPPTITFGYLQGAGTTLAPYVAQTKGMFAANDVNVNFVSVGAGGASLASFASDSINVLLNGPAYIAQARAQGIDLRLFCGAEQSGRTTLIVTSNSTYPDFQTAGSWQKVISSLKGATIAIPAVNGLDSAEFDAMFTAAGMGPGAVKFVGILSAPAALAALQRGDVQAVEGYPFTTEQLLAAGGTRKLIDLTADGPAVFRSFHSGWLAKASYIQANGPALTRFCNAMKEADAYVENPANEATVLNVLSQNVGLPAASIAVIKQEGIKNALYPLGTGLPQTTIQSTLDFLVQNKLLKSTDPSSYSQIVMLPGASKSQG